MHGFGSVDVWGMLQVPGNKVDALSCQRLLLFLEEVFAKKVFLPHFGREITIT